MKNVPREIANTRCLFNRRDGEETCIMRNRQRSGGGGGGGVCGVGGCGVGGGVWSGGG